MGFLSRFFYTLWYFHHPPWDSGIVPPEVVEFIHENPPGRALELGCGTGTSTLALAAAGWRVTGVDFVPGAIALAKRKARNKSLAVDFRIGNVTRLHNTLVSTPYDLILDIGCFHGLSPSDKRIYLDQLPDLLVTGGTWLMYGFINEAKIPGSGSPHRYRINKILFSPGKASGWSG